MASHYKPCIFCEHSYDAFYSDMFYCAARNIQIPNTEMIRNCEFYEKRGGEK